MTCEPLGGESPEWSDGSDPDILNVEVRGAFAELDGAIKIRPLAGGLLHQSFHVRAGQLEYVLQRVSDVFSPGIHANIDAVTRHLMERGFQTATLLKTRGGSATADIAQLGSWRLMPHLGGASFRRLQSLPQARSAGALVGRFHAALRDFDAPLAPMGIHYRDTTRYLAAMRDAIETHRQHRLAAKIAPLGERILAAFDELGPAPVVDERVIHGDLKLDNLLFESLEEPGRDRAFALIDMDTLMRSTLWIELGDAWRSWCNPAGEDTQKTFFSMPLFEASTRGFFEGYVDDIPDFERESLVTAVERITLELCSRYVTDALEESYFGWDASRFATRGDHNLERATGQWNFYEAACECRAEREVILRSAD
jgi:hypothetical protein